MTNIQGDVSFCPCPPDSFGMILLLHIIKTGGVPKADGLGISSGPLMI
jgi:hypothetical protein